MESKGGMKAGSCPNRGESPPMNTTTRSLVLVNHFRDVPVLPESCEDNSDALLHMVHTCYNVAGKRWPNYIAVDFYKRSDGSGAPKAVDVVNGLSVCGCASIADCKENVSYGTCPLQKSDSSFGYSNRGLVLLGSLLVTLSFLLPPFFCGKRMT